MQAKTKICESSQEKAKKTKEGNTFPAIIYKTLFNKSLLFNS